MDIKKYYKKDYEEKITDNFKVKEFACKGNDSDFLLIDIDVVKTLQSCVRNKYGIPIIILSGFRTQAYNQSCGGAPKSKHLEGGAIDFTFANQKIFIDKHKEIIKTLIDAGIKGIGLYIKDRKPPYIHIDNREQKCYWINENGQNYYIDSFLF